MYCKNILSSECIFERQAAVHAFRGVLQGRAAGAWDAHAALMHRSRDRYDSDDFGETIARFAAPAERSFLEWRGAAELQMHRGALMARAQRLAGEHCGRRTTDTRSTSLGSCPASDFVELLGATRAETSGLARCHEATDEPQNGCAQKDRVFKRDIRENHA
jgi:hypothetical protein